MVNVYLCLSDLNLEKVYIDKVKRRIKTATQKNKQALLFSEIFRYKVNIPQWRKSVWLNMLAW